MVMTSKPDYKGLRVNRPGCHDHSADPEWAWNYCDYRIKQQPKTVTLYYYSYNGKVEIFDAPLDPSLNSVRMAHTILIKTETIEGSE